MLYFHNSKNDLQLNFFKGPFVSIELAKLELENYLIFKQKIRKFFNWEKWVVEALCERVVEASSFMILQERMFVGLYPDSGGKSLEGVKQTNNMIRFWSWKRPFPLL